LKIKVLCAYLLTQKTFLFYIFINFVLKDIELNAARSLISSVDACHADSRA